MDQYMYITSNESDNYFLDNKPYKFKVRLKTPLTFHGLWKIGLIEFQAEVDTNRKQSSFPDWLYLISNICKESIVDGEEQPVLRRAGNVGLLERSKLIAGSNSVDLQGPIVHDLFQMSRYCEINKQN